MSWKWHEWLLLGIVAALFLCVIIFVDCAPCHHLETRCVSNVAQICNSDNRWEDMAECSGVEGDATFSCQTDEEGDHVCLPEMQEY